MAKADAYLDSPKMKKKMREKAERILFGIEVVPGGFDLYDVGSEFARVLKDAIQSSSLIPNVEERLLDIKVGSPKKLRGGNYMIPVTFGDDLTRYTMSTKKDYYPVNLATLYNNGVDHVMKQIFERYGEHNEILLRSNTFIGGAHFAESAIKEFTDNYGSKYNLIRIESTFDE